MTETPPRADLSRGKNSREDQRRPRLGPALRKNLSRRKAQARARSSDPSADGERAPPVLYASPDSTPDRS